MNIFDIEQKAIFLKILFVALIALASWHYIGNFYEKKTSTAACLGQAAADSLARQSSSIKECTVYAVALQAN